LIFLDLHQQTLQKLDTIEYDVSGNIVINKADPIRFILKDDIDDGKSLQICKIVDRKIVFGDIIEIDFYPKAFYDKWLYGIVRRDNDRNYLDVRVLYPFC
jgi:hypothetical protein